MQDGLLQERNHLDAKMIARRASVMTRAVATSFTRSPGGKLEALWAPREAQASSGLHAVVSGRLLSRYPRCFDSFDQHRPVHYERGLGSLPHRRADRSPVETLRSRPIYPVESKPVSVKYIIFRSVSDRKTPLRSASMTIWATRYSFATRAVLNACTTDRSCPSYVSEATTPERLHRQLRWLSSRSFA